MKETTTRNAEREMISMSPLTNRGFNEHLDILGISKKDIRGTVLDLGSGLHERFSRKASRLGIKVVSVNPKLGENPDLRQHPPTKLRWLAKIPLLYAPSSQGLSIAATATNLPFKDNSFDTVVSVFAIPMYLQKESYEKAFLEISRVLKPLGKAFLAPLKGFSDKTSEEEMSFLRYALDRNPLIRYFIEPQNAYKKLTLIKK